MCSAAIESLTVAASQDRTVMALTDGEVDRSSGARHERDDRRLVALADDPQDAVTTLEPKILNVGRAGFGHSQPVQPEQHRERCVRVIKTLGSEQERAELATVHPVTFAWLNLGTSDVLGGVGGDAAIDVREPEVAAHR